MQFVCFALLRIASVSLIYGCMSGKCLGRESLDNNILEELLLAIFIFQTHSCERQKGSSLKAKTFLICTPALLAEDQNAESL